MAAFNLSNFQAQPGAASVTQAAAGVGRRNVCLFIYAAIQRVAANASAQVVLRDGATGVGPVLMTIPLSGSTSIPEQFLSDGLFIIGSANTAMTLEFTAGNVNWNTVVGLQGMTI